MFIKLFSTKMVIESILSPFPAHPPSHSKKDSLGVLYTLYWF